METSLVVRPVAAIEKLQEHAASNPAAWAECREGGHAMKTIRVGESEAEGAFERTKRCTRCHTKKHQIIDSNGYVIHSEYEYPDGYQLPKGTGFVDSEGRGAYRTASIHAQIEHQTLTEERAERARQQKLAEERATRTTRTKRTKAA